MAYVNLGQVIYPVGAIFASASPTSPSSMFGGTWSQITGDACLMAGTTIGNAGSKKIAVEKMPAHSHKPPQRHGFNDYFFSINRNVALECTARMPFQYQEGSKYFTIGTNTAAQDSCAKKVSPDSLDDLVDVGATASTGGGKITCLTPTDAICGGEQLNSSDALCVTSKTSKSKLVQVLKQFVHSQLEQYINLLVQQAQPVSMAEGGPLSQTVDSLDRKGLGIILAEKMSIRSLLRKCQVIDICQPIQEKLAILVAERDIQFLLLITMAVMQHILLGKVIAPRTTTFPHTEHVTAGIELPNILGGVLC